MMALKQSLMSATLLIAFRAPAFAVEAVKIGMPPCTGAQAVAHPFGTVVHMRIVGHVAQAPANNPPHSPAMDNITCLRLPNTSPIYS